jgi:tetratricopeptide (TPR) repeat protein
MSGNPEAARWQRLKALLADGLALAAEERADFVERACGGDAALRAELQSLLAAGAAEDSPLDRPPAGRMLDALAQHAGAGWVGRRLGAYRLVGLIARGGMGEVYRGERADGQYEQQVAVKVVRGGADNAVLLERFDAERRILATLDHPNLAKLLDAGVADDGTPYFVMEHVDGQPIDAYCEQQQLAVEGRLRLFRTVCQVVDYAHRQGVVHRDLKPGNILVTTGGVVKLVDFGIAKRVQRAGDPQSPATATAQRALTPEYASPEQVRGEPVGPPSDIYALGVVLYRLLTRASPYGSATADDYALSHAICETEPTAPSHVPQPGGQPESRQLRRRLQGDLDAVVLMALRKEPQRRYASAEQLSDDVFRHLEGLPVQARRGAWSYRAGRFVLRHRAAVGAALVANLALVAGLSLAAYEAYEANRQRERAERHFAGVRKLANVFIFDVHKALERLPGSLAARKMLVDTALAYLQQLAAEAKGDTALQLELAAGFRSIADIQGGGTMASLGDSKGAMASYDQALALVRPLMRSGPSQRAAQAEFVTLAARRGALLMALGQWKDAEAQGQAGIEVAQALVAAEPQSRAHRRQLASQYRFLTSLYQRSGRKDEFERTFALARQQLEALLATAPDDVDTVADLGAVHGVRAVHLAQNVGTREARLEALREYRRSLEVMRPAYEKNPLHVVLASNYGRVHGYAGLLLTGLGRPKEALDDLRRAVEISAALAAKDPGDVRTRTEQAEAHGRLGNALLATRDVAGAIGATTQAIALFDALPETTRNEVVIQYNRAVAHHQLGDALQARAANAAAAPRRADQAAACAQHRIASSLLEENLRRRPSTPMSQRTQADVKAAMARCS